MIIILIECFRITRRILPSAS